MVVLYHFSQVPINSSLVFLNQSLEGNKITSKDFLYRCTIFPVCARHEYDAQKSLTIPHAQFDACFVQCLHFQVLSRINELRRWCGANHPAGTTNSIA